MWPSQIEIILVLIATLIVQWFVQFSHLVLPYKTNTNHTLSFYISRIWRCEWPRGTKACAHDVHMPSWYAQVATLRTIGNHTFSRND
jgi:hypothetical protein